MKILWVSEPGNAGGQYSESSAIEGLTDRWHEITEIQPPIPREGPFHIQRTFIYFMLNLYLRHVMADWKPDVVVGCGNSYPYVFPLAHNRGIRTVLFVRDWHYLCNNLYNHPSPCDEISCFKCRFQEAGLEAPILSIHQRLKLKELKRSKNVIVNSKFMQKEMFRTTGIKSKVIYPPIKPIRVRWEPNSVLHMGGRINKGTDLVIEMAESRPQYQFIISGYNGNDLKEKASILPNVTWHDYIDHDEVYTNAMVVLVPSRWEEPFGRIPVEAGHIGIPTISSNRGGLPESVGKGGIQLDSMELEPWVDALDLLMEDDDTWYEYSKESRKNAKLFDYQNTITEIEKVLLDQGT